MMENTLPIGASATKFLEWLKIYILAKQHDQAFYTMEGTVPLLIYDCQIEPTPGNVFLWICTITAGLYKGKDERRKNVREDFTITLHVEEIDETFSNLSIQYEQIGSKFAGELLIEFANRFPLQKQNEQNRTRGKWSDTENKLKRLRELRRKAIENSRSLPQKIAACGLVGIDSKTVRTHDPKLWENWENKEY